MGRQQLEMSIGLLAVLCTLGLLALSAGQETARMSYQAQVQRAQAIEVGAELYYTHCRSCHGAQGQGVGEMGPPLHTREFFQQRLERVGWQGTLEEYVVATVSLGRLVATRPLYAGDGVVAMAAWSEQQGGPLRPDQIRAIAAFVVNWQATALGEVTLSPLPSPTPDPTELAEAGARGQQVFLTVGCATCHSLAGLSQASLAPDLSHIGGTAESRRPGLSAEQYLRESVLIPNAYFVPGYEPDRVSQRCGGILSQQQLDELVAFLLTLQ